MELSLELTNFGPVRHQKLKLQKGRTLIHGPSGQGKSTLLRAINFVLYGERAKALGKCTVQLEYDKYIIIRRKDPNYLSIKVGKQEYQDAEAQVIINRDFGSEELFKLGTYLVQKSFNPFFDVKASDRFMIIEQILGEELDFDKYNDQLKEWISSRKISKELNETKIEQLIEPVKGLKSETPIDILKCEELSLIQDHERITKEIAVQEVYVKQFHDLNQRLNKIDVDQWFNQLDYLQDHLSKLGQYEEYNRIQAELILLKPEPCDPMLLNDLKYIAKNHSQIKARKSIEQKLIDLNEDHDPIEVENTFNYLEIKSKLDQLPEPRSPKEIKEIKDYNTKLKKYLTINPKKIIIDQIRIDELNRLDSIIKDLSQTITKLKKEKSKLPPIQDHPPVEGSMICPKCQTSLSVQNGSLIAHLDNELWNKHLQLNQKIEHFESQLVNPLSKEDKAYLELYEKLRSEFLGFDHSRGLVDNCQDMEEAWNLNQKIIKLSPNQELINLGLDQLSTIWNRLLIKQNLEKELKAYAQLKWNDNYYDPDLAKIRKKCQDIEEKMATLALWQKLTAQLEILPIPIQSDLTRDFIKNKIKDILEYNQVKKQLTVLPKIKSGLDQKLAMIVQERSKIQEQIKQNELYLKFMEWNSNRDKLELENMTLNQELGSLVNLREQIKISRSEYLDQIIDGINQDIMRLLQDLFDDDITMFLSLFKETKKEAKPAVILNIQLNDRSTENIRDLSGGEGDRISLILTLGFNRILRENNYIIGRWLLLDEVGSSLDSENHEKMMELLQKEGPEMIVAIEHEVSEGHFDHLIDLTKIGSR